VRDLDEARAFYADALGCTVARTQDDFCDVWFYGMQVTLQNRPAEAQSLQAGGCRHFGVTLTRVEFDAVVARLGARDVEWVHAVSTDHAGSVREQTKAKIADPSGNVIEIKTYPDVASALEISAS
jgi:extradiol dioxygenase family protein